jgi:DNA-binding IclR family transcriptional regulator
MVCQNINKKYCLGSAISYLGRKYDENIMPWKACIPHMESLREKTGETVTLGIKENGKATVVYRVVSKHYIKIDGEIGIKLPYYVTSIGKLLAAYDDFEIIKKRIEEEPMVKKTPYTVTEIGALKREYEKIRKNGYSISIEESNIGVISVAAPLIDSEGKVWGCICIGSPKIRTNEKILEYHKELVMFTAKEISSKIFYYNVI